MTTPALSVVIGTTSAPPVLSDCLTALLADGDADLEVLVVDGSAGTGAPPSDQRVRWLRHPGERSLPRLRGHGVAAAHAPLIAILDPYCVIARGWTTEARRIHRERGEPVVGGAVELPASATATQWIVYLTEYWEYVPPLTEGPAAALTGNNLVYKRSALGDVTHLGERGFWKAFVNARLQAAGATLWTDPALRVQLQKDVPWDRFLRSRYHHGRSYAAMRVEGAPRLTRWARAATAALLPPLFLARQAGRLLGRPRTRARFARAIPRLALLHLMWAWGEWCGYLWGPGHSHDRVEF